VTYSWVLHGERKRLPYENPQRRRYNVLALYAPTGPAPCLDWDGRSTHLTSDDLIGLLAVRRRGDVPLIVVLDNASGHRSRDVREAIPQLYLTTRCGLLLTSDTAGQSDDSTPVRP
jgi:transposase InsO family protein